MKSARKLIDLDQETLDILKEEAKKQNRSLKNLLETTIRNSAAKLAVPSSKYTDMMDDMLERLDKGEVGFTPVTEIKKQYGL